MYPVAIIMISTLGQEGFFISDEMLLLEMAFSRFPRLGQRQIEPSAWTSIANHLAHQVVADYEQNVDFCKKPADELPYYLYHICSEMVSFAGNLDFFLLQNDTREAFNVNDQRRHIDLKKLLVTFNAVALFGLAKH